MMSAEMNQNIENDRTSRTFDLAVIGAGSAGFAAAIGAAELGASVALVGHGTIGGTCVNVGCIPSKTLIRAAETLYHAKAASRFEGIEARAHLADWHAVLAHKDELVQSMREAKYRDLIDEYNEISYLEGPARLSPGTISVAGAPLVAGKTIVATGARPVLPAIPGLQDVPYLTSTEALELEELPASLIVMGGGYVGLELAQMFARFGVSVTVVCRSRLLPNIEPELSDALEGYLASEGLIIRKGVTYQGVTEEGGRIVLSISVDGHLDRISGDKLLVATGRIPNSHDLGLESVGVALGSAGGVLVDEFLRTTNEDIYAVGDVTGRDMHVYMAAYGGKWAAENALNGDAHRYDAEAMPAVTFTDPQVATVGLTEAQARGRDIEVKTAVLPLDAVPRALAARDTRGLIKLVADQATDRLLGAHILAPEAGDSIQTAAIAIKAHMSAAELGATIFPYLTTVEGLKLAAQTFEKDVSKLSCCAG
jgi:mercury(II) reductase